MKSSLYNTLHTQRGFSLVEMLVYVAILMIVSSGALSLLFSLTDQINTGRAERIVSHSAEVTLERMLGDIRGSVAVNLFSSTLESTPGVLTVETAATSTQFSVSSGAIVVEENGTIIGPLTDDRVTVDSLIFYRYDNSVTEMVRVAMTLSATVGEATVTRNFEAGAVLRGSYE